MKFSCTQENLKQALTNVTHIAGKNVNLPILSNVLISVEGNAITLITTDLEIGISCSIRGKIEQEGKITVNAKLLNDYINLLPNKRVDVEMIDNELKIKCENYKTKIKGEDANDYPVIPVVDKQEFFTFDFELFKQSIAEVIIATAANETRVELSGVCFQFTDNQLILAATDSYRLAEKKIKYKERKGQENKKIIIPNKTLQEVVRLSFADLTDAIEVEKNINEINLYVTDDQVLFVTDGIELVSRIIEGQYPDYKQIIPKSDDKNKTIAKINQSELTRAIKASSLFSRENINDVHLDFPEKQKKVVVSAVGGQSGESTTEVESDITGQDNGIILNHRYLIDGLNVIKSDQVVLEVFDFNTPCIIRPENSSDYLYIIMPIKQ